MDQKTAITSQMFVAGNCWKFSDLFFLWTGGSIGEFHRDYLINVSTYLFAYIKIDITWHKIDKILSKAIWRYQNKEPLLQNLYFRQGFVFCTLINKVMLKQLLLLMCKGHTLGRSTNLLRRNHPSYVLDWEEKVCRCLVLRSNC